MIADCLRALAPDEIEIALPYLSGEIRQGKLALGYATLQGRASAIAARRAEPHAAATSTAPSQDSRARKGKGAAARTRRRC